jgi:ABC-type Fe3+-siderophore transport system permease subunit
MAAHSRTNGTVRVLGLLVVIAGAILIVAGAVTYGVVSKTLADQKITVSTDAAHFGGQQVTQPWQAYAQANVIAKHAGEIAGGKTYAELPQDDPNRQTVMTASFLQASLFTSVVAFGVAAMAMGLGVVFVLVGVALRRLARDAVPGIAPKGEPATVAPADDIV